MLSMLFSWLRGSQKPLVKVRRFQPSLEALESRECPAL